MNIFALLLLGSCIAQQVTYDQYKVYRVRPKTQQELQLLRNFMERTKAVDFWNSPNRVDTDIDVMVPPELYTEFQGLLYSRNIKSKILVEDVQKHITEERRNFKPRCAYGWTQYATLDQIYAWLYSLPNLYKEVRIITAGNTFEGRNITGVHLSYSWRNKNKAVFIEANMHAREWITSSVATFILNQLLTSQDPEVRKIAESHDWYFVPVANPDGYVYSHEEDRLWDKTRSNPGWFCTGVDAARNWDFHWSDHQILEISCLQDYPGPEPFSETCTKTLSQYISSIGDNLIAYLSVHSYGQVLGIPYAYTPEPLDNYDLAYSIGLQAVESLAKRYGTGYTVGSIYNVMSPSGGRSVDWVKANIKTPLVYMYQLRDAGEYGFLLPPGQIIPTALETLDSIVTILQAYEDGPKSFGTIC